MVACIETDRQTYIHTYTHTHTYILTHIQRTYIHTMKIHTYIYTHIHTYTHTTNIHTYNTDSIRNTINNNHLVEEIRKKMTSLERADWNIDISWVKVHVGIVGNELTDRLAKVTACDSAAKIVFNRLPMNTLISKIEEETKLQWQKEWKECTKAGIIKEFFSSDA